MSSRLALSDVAHVLKPIADKYFEAGVQLGVEVETIRRIEGENQSHSRRLYETIYTWQNNCSSDECSWSTLADAVQRVGGYDNLVMKLRERGKNAPTTRQQRESAEADDTGYSSRSDSISDTCSSSGSETECFDTVPGCGCKEKPCSLYTLCANGCPNPTRKRVHVLRKKQLHETENSELPLVLEGEDDCEEYERETKRIQKQFGKFVTDTCCSFKMLEKVNIQSLTLFLQSSFPALKARMKELNEATCLEQVFKIVIDQCCSWFDYEVIKEMIEHFGDSSDKHRAEKYEEEFRKYAKQRLPKGKKHIEVGSGATVGGKQLVIKVDKEWEEVNFNDIDKLRGSFASILGVRRRELYLADIREGCIRMTFMIPEELAKRIFATKCCLIHSQVQSFKQEDVTSIRCEKFKWRACTDRRAEEKEMEAEMNTVLV